jgi:hypothetical protein
MKLSTPTVICLALSLAAPNHCLLRAEGQPQGANQAALRIQEFCRQVAEYLKLRKTVEGGLPAPKPTASPAKLAHRERELARRVARARSEAKQGDIFAPEISAEFRHLIALTMQGPEGTRIRESLKRAEPVKLPLRVNDSYPPNAPLQSTPPTLLLNLPTLPKQLDYRVVGNSLVLRDSEANLIIDFITQAIS